MAFDPDAYLAESNTATAGGFDPDEYLNTPLSKVPANAMKDIGGIAQAGLKMSKAVVDPANIIESGLAGSMQPTKDYLSDSWNQLKAMPGAIGHEIKQTVTHPIETFKQHPVNTALNVAGGFGLAGKGLGMLGKLGQGAELASEAGAAAEVAPELGAVASKAPGLRTAVKLPEKTYIGEPGDLHVDVIRKIAQEKGIPESQAYDLINKIGDQGFTQGEKFLNRQEASQVAGGVKGEAASLLNAGKMEGAPEVPPPLPGIRETISNLGEKLPPEVKGPLGEVNQFLTKKFESPGIKQMIGESMTRGAQGMRFRELGGTPGQARKLEPIIGESGIRELTDIAKEKGITKSPVGYVRRQATDNLMKSSGQAIGGIREIAAKRGAMHDPNSLVQKIRQSLDPDYLGKGTKSVQKGAYLKALKDIQSAATTPDVLAKKITELNQYATKNKMTQATGAISDVANEASRINNDLIKKHLSPKESGFYDESLKDFSASKIFKKLQSYELGREMGGRSGPGGIVRNIKQAAMDLGGNKVIENFYEKFGPKLKGPAGASKSLASLSEAALDDLLSSLDDALTEVSGQ